MTIRLPVRLPFAAALALAALALGCASAGTSVDEQQIEAARQSGSLEELLARVEADLSAEGGSPSEHTLAMRARIGSLLAEKTSEEIRDELEKARRDDGLLGLASIDDARVRLPEVQHLDPATAKRLEIFLDQETERTEKAIATRLSERDALPEEEVAKRLDLTNDVLELSAPGTDRTLSLEGERRDLLAQVQKSVDTAIQNEQYEEAGRMARLAAEADPDNPAIREQVDTIDSKLFEQRFWKALETGDPDGAYKMLKEASEADNFDAIRSHLASSADPMADFFVALAAEATGKGNLPEAYRWFSQARSIRRLLGKGQLEQRPEEAAFVEIVKKRYWEARKEGQPGLAWAFISVIQELEPDSPSLRRMVRETREQVEQVAVKRLAALPFQNSSGGPEFGEAVSSKVIQHLFQTIPQDIRIIEREQLADILREKEIGQGKEKLASADYIVQGDILEAKVDSTEKKGKKTMRVVTETVTEQNPAYLRWLELDSDDRDDIPQPPQEIKVAKKEDVSVNMTLHRKVGVFSVSYRLIDANSAKVLYADSLHKKIENEDTSTEGVELGDFKLPFKLASLPSDLEILQQLSDEVSAEIGDRLAKVLENPEDRYAETGERFVSEGNFAKASEQFAYADVLATRKGKDTEAIGEQLRDAAVRSIERVVASKH